MSSNSNSNSNSGGGNSNGNSNGGKDVNGIDDPVTHDVTDDQGVDDPATHDVIDDHGIDDPATHDVADDHGIDDPATHDLGDDHGVDDPATHDLGDDHGVDDPATHDLGDDHGVDDPATHDVGDDHGGAQSLQLFLDQNTQQVVFSDDSSDLLRWSTDDSKVSLGLPVDLPVAGAQTVPVWRFHDSASDMFFWTADASLKDSLLSSHPELEFDGEAFQAYQDQASGGQVAIGLAWDHGFDGAYGRFVYAPLADAVALGEQSSSDDIDFIGVAFWI